ncbi:MAG: rhodanese-like domain-containing protein [Acidobacteriota bacterium]|nr:rhodanese-like domain-containing protein [Acidobacteriota bacterium]
MNWTSVVIVVALLVLFFLLKRAGQISRKAAAEHLKHGAMVIDVRTAAEYTAGHLPKAINMPLSEIEALVPRKVQDKNRVLLLHCQSGSRSGVAKRRLVAMGYTNTFNLGSYNRATQIVSGR